MRYTEFSQSEYEERYKRAWQLMRAQGLAGLFVTSEANYRYLTGHRTQFWVSHSRPMFAVLPYGRPPIALMTEIEEAVFRSTSRLEDIRTWLGFEDDSLPILADMFRELGFQGERIGVDFGAEMRLGLPITSFRKLESLAKGVKFVDASPLLWSLRQIKSPREIAYIRKACRAAARGLRRGWRCLRVGMTERELQRRMAVAMLESGADKVQWLPIHSGPGNYAKFTMEPTGRRFRPGDMVWVDAGVTINGYWSDFNRIAAVEKATPVQRDAYRTIWEITRACIEAVRPGIPICDVVKVRDVAYERLGFVETGSRSGRMGHGSGLDITEPPSVGAHDTTVIEPGMVLHIEPKMIHPFGFFQLEEVIAVTENGSEYLSPAAPQHLPVVGAA